MVGAYGDNFDEPASQLGQSLGLGTGELADLQQLGICLNYNGYGFELDDLMFNPVELFGLVFSLCPGPGDPSPGRGAAR